MGDAHRRGQTSPAPLITRPRRPWLGKLQSGLVLAVVLVALPASTAYAAPGDLDTSFGPGGLASGGSNGFGHGMVIQANGDIIVSGTTTDQAGHNVFALTRYTSTGAVDTSFGSGGSIKTSFSSNGTELETDNFGLVQQADGKLIAVGAAHGSGSEGYFAAARYSADGTLDPFYANGGRLLATYGGFAQGLGALIQPDGKLVMVGAAYSANFAQRSFAVARFNLDGSPDTGFGTGGVATTPFGTAGHSFAVAYSVVRDPSGLLTVAGWNQDTVGDDGSARLAVARYLPNGSADTGFGSGGTLLTAMKMSETWGIAQQPDGKVVVGGEGFNGSRSDFGLARVTCSGSLDASLERRHCWTRRSTTPKIPALALCSSSLTGNLVAAGTAETVNHGTWEWGSSGISRMARWTQPSATAAKY